MSRVFQNREKEKKTETQRSNKILLQKLFFLDLNLKEGSRKIY